MENTTDILKQTEGETAAVNATASTEAAAAAATEAVETTETVNAEELLKKFDKDSKSRNFKGIYKLVANALFLGFAVYVIVAALLLKRVTTFTKLPVFLGLTMFLGFIKYPACNKDSERENYMPWYDVILAILSLASCLYYTINQDVIVYMGGEINTAQIIVGIVAILLLFELCRRSTGIPLMVVAFGFLIYATIWLLKSNPSLTLNNLIYNIYYNVDCGIFSTPVTVCCNFIVIFIIFGAFLEKSGIGAFFVDLANSVVGSAAGGPAKVAVISSALMGMYSGSSVANTVGSGSITIPMMKKTGYKPEFAAAVEAAASTGGQIMPPIMGAAAFLMAQITGVAYSKIIVCAILPAILYFGGIFLMVHLEAKKLGLNGLPKDAVPKFLKLVAKKGYLLIPVVVLVICMNSYTPAMSACFAILTAICVSLIDEDLIEDLTSKNKQKIIIAVLSLVFAALPIGLFFILDNTLSTQSTARGLFVALAVAAAFTIAISTLKSLDKVIRSKNPKTAARVAAVTSTFTAMEKKVPINAKKLGEGFVSGTNSSLGVVIACAMAGIISGVVSLTGLGSTLITLIVPIASKSLILALFLTMLCCIVLGMGVPTTANYVIMATITAPILIGMGVPVLAAHMFVFYFGIIADITPPVALAAYAGSAIAGANPLKTGVTATKLAIAAFIIPYIFALNPAMLFINTTWYEVLLIIVTSLVGMFGVAIGMQGYAKGKVHWALRLVSVAGGLLLIYPGIVTDTIGLVLVGGVIAFQFIMFYKKNKHSDGNGGIGGDKTDSKGSDEDDEAAVIAANTILN